MKYLLLLSVIFLSTCTSNLGEDERTEDEDLFEIFIMAANPNGSGDKYTAVMYKEAFAGYLEYVK